MATDTSRSDTYLRQPGSSHLRLARVSAGVSLVGGTLIVHVATPISGSITTWAATLTLAIVGTLLVAWRPDRGAGGAAFLYVIIFGLFHCGLIAAVAIGGEDYVLGQGDNSWILAPEVADAITAVTCGLLALSVGMGVTATANGRGRPQPLARDSPTLQWVGYLALTAGTALLFASVVPRGGLGAFFGGYAQLLEQVEGDGAFGYATLLLSLGVCFLVAEGGTSRVVGWIVFALIASVGLPVGLRGTVLFLGVVLLVLEAKRRRLPLAVFVAGAVGVLGIISIVRVTRAGGLAELLEGRAPFAPLESLAEMGYSIYPVVVVQNWMASGIEAQNGATFVAPLLRSIESALGLISPEPDFRLFNVEVMTLVGPIGGSPVAEGYRNFGYGGVFVLMLLVGITLVLIDRLPSTPLGGALTTILLIPLMISVRNSFAPFFIQVGIGAVLVLSAVLAHRMTEKAK